MMRHSLRNGFCRLPAVPELTTAHSAAASSAPTRSASMTNGCKFLLKSITVGGHRDARNMYWRVKQRCSAGLNLKVLGCSRLFVLPPDVCRCRPDFATCQCYIPSGPATGNVKSAFRLKSAPNGIRFDPFGARFGFQSLKSHQWKQEHWHTFLTSTDCFERY